MKVDYFVFTGTGNTLLVAKKIGGRLEEKGCDVEYHAIEKDMDIQIDDGVMVGLAFPIAFFSSYPIVLDFVSALPKGNGRKIFMSASMGGMGMGVEGKFRQMVKAKGYVPAGAELFIMPGNYNNAKIPFAQNKELVAAAMKKCDAFADSLIDGTAKWGRGIPIIPTVWKSLVYSGRALRFFYRMFPIQIDIGKCVKCMHCLDNCPVRAIDKNAENLFIRIDKCQSCQRCVAFCPEHAIVVQGKPAAQYRAVEFEEFKKLKS